MAEVFIDSLTIENFGPYYGSHTLRFGDLGDRCGVLVGGKMGAGKTHLLRALYLAVVGEAGVVDLRKVESGSDATRFAFDRSLNRRALSEGIDSCRLSVNLTLRDEGSGGSRSAEIIREIRHRPNSSPVWTSFAKRSDTTTEISDDTLIQKLRDAFLPRHLARFFFFDAERSQNLNLGQQDIVEGISRVLGLWSYSSLEGDLRQLINSKIPKVFNSTGAADAERRRADLNAEILKLEGHLTADQNDLTNTEMELGEKESELSEVEDELRALGAVDPEMLADSTSEVVPLAEPGAGGFYMW
jgi:DNA sulfur modification protein DndD